MKEAIDAIVAPLLPRHKNVALAIGAIDRDQRFIFGYGQANKALPLPPTADTLFEIGSITKVFTTTLLACCVAEGLVKWDDAVRDLIPEPFSLPPELTLLRLATHTSGLPMLPFSLPQYLLKGRRNPFADFSTDDLLAFLASYRPKRFASSRSGLPDYSNVGAALLGYVLAQRLSVSYEEAVVSRICSRLEMPNTRMTLTAEQRQRLATPHSPSGKVTSNWDLPGLAGAGALRSTADDMLRFLGANFGRADTTLSDVMSTCREIHVETPPPSTFGPRETIARRLASRLGYIELSPVGVALGWAVNRLGTAGHRVYWHDGLTGGYSAYAAFVQETETAVVVLSNRAFGEYDMLFPAPSVYAIGCRVLKLLNGVGE